MWEVKINKAALCQNPCGEVSKSFTLLEPYTPLCVGHKVFHNSPAAG